MYFCQLSSKGAIFKFCDLNLGNSELARGWAVSTTFKAIWMCEDRLLELFGAKALSVNMALNEWKCYQCAILT